MSQRVIIVGGGFGGVTLAQHLERKLTSESEIVLISSENHFVFTPMLAEVVGRSISPVHMSVAGRQMVRRTTWLTAHVTDIDLQTHIVRYVGAGWRKRIADIRSPGAGLRLGSEHEYNAWPCRLRLPDEDAGRCDLSRQRFDITIRRGRSRDRYRSPEATPEFRSHWGRIQRRRSSRSDDGGGKSCGSLLSESRNRAPTHHSVTTWQPADPRIECAVTLYICL